jgi:hypothetical protein
VRQRNQEKSRKNKNLITFNRSLKGFGNSYHDIGTKYPEDVIEEKTSKKDASSNNIVQM